MCGRYYVTRGFQDDIDEIVSGLNGRLGSMIEAEKPEIQAAHDIHPTELASVIVQNRENRFERREMRWGLPATQHHGMIINARSESIERKEIFSTSVERRRIAIPAAGFYEWNANREKVTFFLKEQPMLYLLGIYDICEDGERFAIITTSANESIIRTHDRMPCMVNREGLPEWLRSGGDFRGVLNAEQPLLDHRQEYEQLSLF